MLLGSSLISLIACSNRNTGGRMHRHAHIHNMQFATTTNRRDVSSSRGCLHCQRRSALLCKHRDSMYVRGWVSGAGVWVTNDSDVAAPSQLVVICGARDSTLPYPQPQLAADILHRLSPCKTLGASAPAPPPLARPFAKAWTCLWTLEHWTTTPAERPAASTTSVAAAAHSRQDH